MIWLLQTASFWRTAPALLVAITLLFGVSSFLFWPFPWNYLFPIFWGAYLLFQRSWPYIFILIASIFYSFWVAPIPLQAEKGIFSISSLQPHISPFHKGLVYKGTLYTKDSSIPCSVYYKGSIKDRPLAHRDYFMTGQLHFRDSDFIFKAKEWEQIEGSFSFAELRYKAKEWFKRYLEKHLSTRSALFLSSLTTGDVEDRMLRYEFGRIGLQHLLSISGFHFAIVLAICSFLFKAVFPRPIAFFFLALSIHVYFLFVGSSPAVQRSWFVAELYLIATWLNRNSSALNLLGCGAIFEVLIDPRIVGNIGFQLSFLSTAGILLFCGPIEHLLEKILPRRSYSEANQLSLGSKFICLGAKILRRSLSLNFAVNVSILPLLLYHFHQFPYLSLIYNLFIPALVGIALFLLCFCFLVPDLFFVCDFLTQQILDLISNPPMVLDYALRCSSLQAWMVPFYLLLLLFIVVYPNEHLIVRDPLSKISLSYGDRSSVG